MITQLYASLARNALKILLTVRIFAIRGNLAIQFYEDGKDDDEIVHRVVNLWQRG